jgi:hypothetical protein
MLYRNGKLLDEYDSNPDYGEVAENPRAPEGGDIDKLCTAFPSCDRVKTDAVLRFNKYAAPETESKYLFEYHRHRDLVAALNLSSDAVALGYTYLEMGDIGPERKISDFTRIRK